MSGSEEEEDSNWGGRRQHQRGGRLPRARGGRAGRGEGRGRGRGGLASFPDKWRGQGGVWKDSGDGSNPLPSSSTPSLDPDSGSWTGGLTPPGPGIFRTNRRGRERQFQSSGDHDTQQAWAQRQGRPPRSSADTDSDSHLACAFPVFGSRDDLSRDAVTERRRASDNRQPSSFPHPRGSTDKSFPPSLSGRRSSGSSLRGRRESLSQVNRDQDQRIIRRCGRAEGPGGNGPNRPGRADRPRRHRFLTDESLQELTQEDDPDNVMMALASDHGGLKDLLTKPSLELSTLTLLLRCLPAVCRSQQRAHVTHILSILCECGFFLKHLMALASSLLQAVTSGSLDRGFREVLAALTVVPDLVNQVLQRLPSSAEKCKPALVLLREALKVYDVEGRYTELLLALQTSEFECSEEMRRQQQQQQGGSRSRRDRGMAGKDDLPPEDFRLLPVFPTHHELQLDERPFLRANVTRGKYRDAEQYLDIQFRLLREDYIAPLRESIGAYRKHLEEGRSPSHVKGIRMYRGVHVIDTRCEESVDHVLQFNVNTKHRIRWDASKRLITGSLVCLTNDHFRTLVFATVTGRRVEDLEKGNVNVQFELLDLDASRFTKEHPALMAESSAFFEAYRPVLECLKNFQTPLPFEKYLVHVHPYVDPPAYLNDETRYNLRSLLTPETRHATSTKAAIRTNSRLFIASVGETESNAEQLLDARGEPCESRNVPVLQLDMWPAISNLCLNQSQLEAAQTALTKELAIIQGPPGTGKTYVGLQVVKVLLDNSNRSLPEPSVVTDKGKDPDKDRDMESRESPSPTEEISASHSAEYSEEEAASNRTRTETPEAKPILVVCYTNHALDQFLEGILKFCPDGIVRVGGRSKSEVLAKYNLREFQPKDFRGKVREVVRVGYLQCRNEMRKTQTIMEGKKAQIAMSTAGIVNQKFLEIGMTKNQFSSLQQDETEKTSGDENPLLAWLGFGRKSIFANEKPRLQIHQTLCGELKKSLFVDDSQRISEGGNIEMYLDALEDFQNSLENYIEQLEEARDQASGREQKKIRQKLREMQRLLQRSRQEILPMEQIRLFLEQHTKYAMDGLDVREWLGIHADPGLCADMLHKLVKQAPQQQQQSATSVERSSGELGEAELLCEERALDDKDALLTGGQVSQEALFRARSELLLTPQAFQLPPIPLPGSPMINHEMDRLGQRLAEVLQGKELASEEEAARVEDVWSVPPARRPALYRLFLRRAVRNMTESLREDLEHYRDLASRRRELSMENTVDILKTATVIGMTTTGAAKHSSAIHKVRPRVVVVEEAAEVLESHLLATLHPGCQQLLLIGDHQQLCPTPAVYELAKRFKLDVSLFERMVTNKVHHKVLNVQHRMRPEISALVKLLYPDLADHPSVLSRDHIRGMACDVFFLQHEHEEEQVADTHTKANHYEAEMLVALCGYLLQQGYSPDKITILATYMGQVSLIRDLMKKNQLISSFLDSPSKTGARALKDPASKGERVNVTPVDNFQGEENDVILLSLVRSNEDGSVGFLSIDNRVCVALSRARLGLFAVGNLHLLARKSSLWKRVCDTLTAAGQLGSSLPLRCHCHPDQTNYVTSPEEFAKVAPHGGCRLLCGKQLPCGHLCEETCHPIKDAEDHRYKSCMLPCKKSCNNDHPCPKPCYEDCGRCRVPVQKTMSPCGHLKSMLCYEEKHWKCREPCPKTLACGHKCKGTCDSCQYGCCTMCVETVQKVLPCGHGQDAKCHERPKSIWCLSQVTITRSTCGHDMTVVCYSRLWVNKTRCEIPTEKFILECGHKIEMKCCDTPKRSQCKEICDKVLPCSHKCQYTCSECASQFQYPSLLKHTSLHPPCRQKIKVTLGCGHETETPCCDKDKATCKSNCEAVLTCGHQCQGKCAECTERGTHGSCTTLVSRRLNCGHEASQVKCGHLQAYVCSKQCGARLACGHLCQAACNTCLEGRLHQPCSAMCGKPLLCSHYCKKRCGEDCQPCQARCLVRCPHWSCQQSCSDPCKPCPRPCLRRCDHVTCPLKCSDLCLVLPCNRPCKRRLKKKCGHACAGVCGEPCFCRDCNEDKIKCIDMPHLQKGGGTETKMEDKRSGENQLSFSSYQTESAATEVPQAHPASEIGDITTNINQALVERQDNGSCSTENQTKNMDLKPNAECPSQTDHTVAAESHTADGRQSKINTNTDNAHDTTDSTDKSGEHPPEDSTTTERDQTDTEPKYQEKKSTSPEASKEKDVTREKLKKTLFQLHDCGHIFPINDLDDYMATCVEPGSLPRCPDCGSLVISNVRYGDLIKRTLAQREEAKKKTQAVPRLPVDTQDILALMNTLTLKEQDFKKLIEFNKQPNHGPSPRLVSSFRRRLHLLRALASGKGLQRWMSKNMSTVDIALQKQIDAFKDVLLASTEEVSPAEEGKLLELDRLSLFARLSFIKQHLSTGNKCGDKEEAHLHPRKESEDRTEKSADDSSRNVWDVADEQLRQRLTSVYAALAAGDVVRETFDEMMETYKALVSSLTSQPLMADVLTRVGTFPDLRAIASGTGWSGRRGGDAEGSDEDDGKKNTTAEMHKNASPTISIPATKTATSKSKVDVLFSTKERSLHQIQGQGGRGRGRGKRRNKQQQQHDQEHSYQKQQFRWQHEQWYQDQHRPQQQQQQNLLDFILQPAYVAKYGHFEDDFTVQPRQKGGRGGQ